MMRIAIALSVLLAAGCHGGGSSNSADLQQSHPQLLGTWSGEAVSVRAGQRSSLLLRIDPMTGHPDRFAWDLSASGSPCVSVMQGTLTASGDRVSLVSTSFPSTSFSGSLTTPTMIVGEYSIGEGLCVGDRGSINLARLSNAILLEEIHSWPDLDVIVQVRSGR